MCIRDSCNGEEGESMRAFYLTAWDGMKSFSVDRIGRGSIYISRLCLSLFGSIQPDKLQKYLQKTTNSLTIDGLFQRFQVLVYPDVKNFPYVDRDPNIQAQTELRSFFQRLGHEDPRLWGAIADTTTQVPYFRFDEQAQQSYQNWVQQTLPSLVKEDGEDEPIVQQHFAKYEKLLASLALIFHVISCLQTGPQSAISAETFVRAQHWCGYLATHARRCYWLTHKTASLYSAQVLLSKIKQEKLTEGFTAYDVKRPQWGQLTQEERIVEALRYLELYGWIRPAPYEKQVGRSTIRYQIHPSLRTVKTVKIEDSAVFTVQNPSDSYEQQERAAIMEYESKLDKINSERTAGNVYA